MPSPAAPQRQPDKYVAEKIPARRIETEAGTERAVHLPPGTPTPLLGNAPPSAAVANDKTEEQNSAFKRFSDNMPRNQNESRRAYRMRLVAAMKTQQATQKQQKQPAEAVAEIPTPHEREASPGSIDGEPLAPHGQPDIPNDPPANRAREVRYLTDKRRAVRRQPGAVLVPNAEKRQAREERGHSQQRPRRIWGSGRKR